jgi:hypothetical protein
MITTLDRLEARRHQSTDLEAVRLLNRICQQLEITPAMFALAKERYESIAAYLQAPDSPLRKFDPQVYPQGSINLGTTVRPIGSNEFDVDVICQFAAADRTLVTAFKDGILKRLSARGIYKLLLKNRCVRVQYANEFHIDITPAIPDYLQGPENILVADKQARSAKESNPKDYKTWFDDICSVEPSLMYAEVELKEKYAAAESLPVPKFSKPLLQRLIQLMKRHRDQMFEGSKDGPISAIITTLAAQSYESQVRRESYASQLHFFRSVVAAMPDFIDRSGLHESVPNPANRRENFADKWPPHPERREAFYLWHEEVVGHFDSILATLGQGKEHFFEALSSGYGKDLVTSAAVEESEERKELLDQRKLGVTKRSGITAPITASSLVSSVMPVPKHTNFGE